jgi:hypothetical protein
MPKYAKGKTTVDRNTGKVTKHDSEKDAKKAAKKSYAKKRKRLGH